MKYRLLIGLLIVIGLITLAAPARAESSSMLDQAFGQTPKAQKQPASVSIVPTFTAAKEAMEVRVTYAAEHTLRWRSDGTQVERFGKKIKAIEVYVNGTARKVQFITPSFKGEVTVKVPLGFLSAAERAKELKVQAKIYTRFKQSDNHKAKNRNKPVAASAIVTMPAPNPPVDPVSWAPSPLQPSGLAGTHTSASVAITPKKKLEKVSFKLSSGPATLLVPSSNTSATLEANTSYPIPLTISIAGNAAAGKHKATLELLSGGQVVSKLPLDITVTAATATAIPQTIGSPSKDRIVTDGEQRLVKDELVVGLDLSLAAADQRIKDIAAQTQAVIMGSDPGANMYLLRYKVANLGQLEAIRAKLEKQAAVSFAAQNYVLATATPPNDSQYPVGSWEETVQQQRNWGQKYMKLPAAWDITTGNAATRIGVIDVGFDAAHEDLIGNIKTKSLTGDPGAAKEYHGNHVSGILCGSGNNGKGIAGVNWRCSLGLYTAGPEMTAANTEVVMRKAADEDMRIVNMSLGQQPSKCGEPADPEKTLEAVERSNAILSRGIVWAESNNKDVLWVFAAGNDCRDIKYDSPASLVQVTDFANTMAVAAIGENGQLWSRSNFGNDVTVAAPGQNIHSTVGTNCPFEVAASCQSNYANMSGTSQAAPFISGLAGLVRSKHSDFTATQIKECIVKAATIPVPGRNFKVVNAPAAVNCKPVPTAACQFQSDGPHECESTDPTVTLMVTHRGDSSGCNFNSHVVWGDGQAQDFPIPGELGPSVKPYATHAYKAPGVYRIDLTGSVVSGHFFCSISSGSYTFTLHPKPAP